MAKLVSAGAVALALLLGGAARAEPEAPATAAPAAGSPAPMAGKLNEEGFALYKQREYRRAAEKFLQAYGLEPDPNLLFNIARCYEALGDTAAAEEKYKLFLAAPDADPEGKRRAQEALRTLAERRDQALPPTPGAPAPALVEPTLVTTAPPKEGRPRRMLPTVVLGVGAAAVIAGATLYFLGRRDFNTVTDAPGYGDPNRVDAMTEPQARQLVDSGHSKVIAGGVMFGVGVAALAASAALLRWTF